MNGPIEELAAAEEHLLVAGDALQSAADMLADLAADRWADRGGIGNPPTDVRIARLYTMAEQVVLMLDRLGTIREELQQ